MKNGKVLEIFISPAQGAPIVAVDQIMAIAGQGLAGDRYCAKSDSPQGNKDAVTLLDISSVAACNLELSTSFTAADFRRNIITSDIDLNSLVGKQFKVGDALLLGFELCHPCNYLSKTLQADVLRGLLNRGGLRARITQSGTIARGSSIERFQEKKE